MTDRIPVTDHAWLALVTPPFLLLFLAGVVAYAAPVPRPSRGPTALIAGGILLIVASALSLIETDAVNDTVAMALLGLVVPAGLYATVRRADLPLAPIVWSFLIVSSLLLLRADLVFFGDYGFGPPSGEDLFQAKFSSVPYDFHYFGLGNPDQTSTFTLMPFAISCFIASSTATSQRARRAALTVAAVCGLTLVLLYVRIPLVFAGAIGVWALLRSSASRAAKGVALAGIGVLLLYFVTDSTTLDYIKKLFDTDEGSSGNDRARSIFKGFEALGDHPLTGEGLGRFGFRDGQPPAHSAIAQAAADLGVLGLIGILLVLGSISALAIRAIRGRGDQPALLAATAFGVGVYGLAAALVGGATAGVAIGFISVWGMSVGLLLGVVTAPDRTPHWVPEALQTRSGAAEWLTATWARVRGRLDRTPEPGRVLPPPGMIAFGLLLGLGVAFYLHRHMPAQLTLLQTRIDDLSATFAAHEMGRGPLVGFIEGQGYFPSGMADNPGMYWVLPGFGDLVGADGWASAYRTFYIALVSVCAAALPSITGRMFGSSLAGVVVSLAAVYGFRYVDVADFYFLLAVTAAIGLPLLLLVDRSWIRSRPVPPWSLIGVMVFASVMSMLRNGTGTPLVLVALLIVWRHTTWKHRLPAILVTLVAFVSVSHGVIRVVEAARAGNMGDTPIAASYQPIVSADSFDDEFKRRSIPFHLIYIGLGFDSNKYGILYLDENAAFYALSVDPDATYGTPRYNEVLQDRFFDILGDDPGFIIKTTVRKALVALDDGIGRFPIALLVIVGAFLFTPRRSMARRWVGLLLVAGAAAMFYPLSVIPADRYQLAWWTALGWIWLCGLGWTIAALQPGLTRRLKRTPLPDAVAPLGRLDTFSHPGGVRALSARAGEHLVAVGSARLRRPAPERPAPWFGEEQRDAIRRRGPRKIALAVVAVAVLLVGVRLASDGPQKAIDELGGTSMMLPATEPRGDFTQEPSLEQWSFRKRLPRGWSADAATYTAARDRLEVTTEATLDASHLAGPAVALEAGEYLATLRGGTDVGGLRLSVLDTRSGAILGTGSYPAKRIYGEVSFPVRFTVPAATRVRLTVNNYALEPTASEWILRDATIYPLAGN